jgi:hypothetical protein
VENGGTAMSAAQARNTHLVRDNAAEYGIGICEQSSIHTAGGHPAACVSDSGGIRNGESLGQFQPLHSPFSWRPGIHKEKFSAATSSLSSSSISLGFDFVKLVNLISQIPNQFFMNLEMNHLNG